MKTRIRLKNLYLIAIIAIGLIGLGIGSTFAMFTAQATINNPIAFNSNLSSTNLLAETIEVIVPAEEDKYVDLVISNTNAESLNYNVWYAPSSNDLEVGSESSNNSYGPVGVLPSAGNFTLTVGLRNNGDSPITVTIGISSSGDTVVLPSGVTSVPATKLMQKTLYSVLKLLSDEDLYVTKYTGNHQDSMDSSESIKDIYHFYANNNTDKNVVKNMNNVVFGGQCWQIIRTTDTGGTRLLYNGEPTIGEENGKITYYCGSNRPAHIGGVKSTKNLSGTFYYASSYTAILSGTTTTFTLVNPVQVQVTSNDAEEKIAEIAANYPYTCMKTSADTTCTNTAFYKVLNRISGTTANVYASVTTNDTLGAIAFNNTYTSIADVGYMYNNRSYLAGSHSISSTLTMLSQIELTDSNLTTYGDYYFGDGYLVRGGYKDLTNAAKGNTVLNNPSSWKNMYLCKSSTNSFCSTMYYVADIDQNNMMYLLEIGYGKNLNDYNYLFGDGISDNGDGTFSLTGTVREINASNWNSEYSTKLNKYVCMAGYYTFDSSTGINVCSDNGTARVGTLRFITSTNTNNFTATSIYKYGLDIQLDTGSTYELIGDNNDDQTLKYIYNWPNQATSNCFAANDGMSGCGYQTLSRSHYTCFNLSGKCSTYYYIFYSDSNKVYYTSMTGGKYVSTDLTDNNNILYIALYQNDNNGNVNTINSKIKETIDEWYQNTLLTNFDSYIEDTIFCNNRTITSFGGWNPDGGTTSSNYGLQFKESTLGDTADLSCSNITDRFSTNNSSARLTYKVGLISKSELKLLKQALFQSTDYRIISPSSFGMYSASNYYIANNGRYESTGVHYGKGVRPFISLKSDVTFSRGDGKEDNPYIIKTEH